MTPVEAVSQRSRLGDPCRRSLIADSGGPSHVRRLPRHTAKRTSPIITTVIAASVQSGREKVTTVGPEAGGVACCARAWATSAPIQTPLAQHARDNFRTAEDIDLKSSFQDSPGRPHLHRSHSERTTGRELLAISAGVSLAAQEESIVVVRTGFEKVSASKQKAFSELIPADRDQAGRKRHSISSSGWRMRAKSLARSETVFQLGEQRFIHCA